jgi:dihydrofolate synthase/folylpolyglutamate synthase
MEFLGPDRESIGLEKAGILRTGRRPSSATRAAAKRDRPRARDRRRPVAALATTSTSRATSSNGLGRARPALRRAGLPGPARRQPAGECLGRAGRAGVAARAPAGDGAGGAQRPGDGGAAGALPDRAGPARWCWTWRTTRIRWRRWRPTWTPWAFTPPRMPCSVPWPTRTWRPCWRKLGPLVDRWYFTDLPTARAETAPACSAVAGRRVPQGRRGQHLARPPGPARGHRRADPADRIVVFGSFYTVGGVLKDGIPRLQAAHLAD